ncbi:MAG: topoisomerase protein [Candidatus Amesbacteria bacterium GW2011_GWA2_47_11b]|uniref:DNA topoisomerase 1 n=2 Tax=Candidatus Amesiibacteriota TaxID=1752730 RepID=A0A0G1TW45_9BACT|nr:MAG: topoisomerase protein [Candidatus Amesbacteria bacterium GW2011_GWA2_47_11b]
MDLVIVESPTKARTLGKFLGEGYTIEASYGHIRDLPQKKLGIKTDKNFEPEYVQTKKQEDRIKEIKRLSDGATKIYLATDPDREGEAIAFHVAELLKGNSKSEIRNPKFSRIVFHEITEHAIKEALEHPRELDMKLVDAQQARRILDRLVGYKLSPLLWKKVRRGLSAGRVQSVTVRLVVEREREIEAFKPEEYWDIFVELKSQKSKVKTETQNLKVKLILDIKSAVEAQKAEDDLRGANYVVESVEKKEFRRTPPAPFTTSTLQQAAANRLGWSAKRTMQVAQTLYEEGYITYHRTDSTNLAMEAIGTARDFISHNFGQNYALEKPRFFKTKSKVAQEAHEAIRPTSVQTLASSVQKNRDQQKLYEMIWKRFVACQMAEARGVTVTVTVTAREYKLQAKGDTITFEGWYKLNGDTNELRLPEVAEGEKLEFVDLTKEQKFTQPPARYNDASLIKALEEMGIGRPSTYAPTLSTIQDRQYVEKIDKRFKPTSLGLAVNDFLVANFPNIVDYEFTANMEYGLDEVANGEKKWQPLLADFYTPFEKQLADVTQTAERVKIETEKTGEKCPKCQVGDVVIRLGKFGKFLSCSTYPECDYKANYQNKTGQKCAKCGDGDVIIRKTRTGRSFYGCSNYPKCDFASWTKPK